VFGRVNELQTLTCASGCRQKDTPIHTATSVFQFVTCVRVTLSPMPLKAPMRQSFSDCSRWTSASADAAAAALSCQMWNAAGLYKRKARGIRLFRPEKPSRSNKLSLALKNEWDASARSDWLLACQSRYVTCFTVGHFCTFQAHVVHPFAGKVYKLQKTTRSCDLGSAVLPPPPNIL
jgi:hypothetical protein